MTTASHMRRALACFRSAGVDAIPAPTEFYQPPDELGILNWLPDAGALRTTTLIVKEYLGLLVYRFRGWA